MRRARTAAEVVFYGGLLAVMAAIFLQLLGDVLPDGLARSVGYNSEGYTLALVVAAWIQFARPRLLGDRREWSATLVVGVLLAVVGIALLASDLPSRFRTLNEAFLAAALAVPYLQLRRPLPRWVPWSLSGALALVLLAYALSGLTGLAEMLGLLVLLPLAVDVFDRRVLDPGDRTPRMLAYAFYGALVVVIAGLYVLGRAQLGGDLGAVVSYLHRMQESFVSVLLVLVYFAVLRALAGSRGRHAGRRVAA